MLVNNEFIESEEVLTKVICQFYLSRTYSDILKMDSIHKNYEKQEISVFTKFRDGGELQKHHIMPVGELGTIYKNVEKEVYGDSRNDRMNMYNSPLNFAYISPKANRIILNSLLSYYKQYCDETTLIFLGIESQNIHNIPKDSTELEEFLRGRYKDLCAKLKKVFSENLAIPETEFKNFG